MDRRSFLGAGAGALAGVAGAGIAKGSAAEGTPLQFRRGTPGQRVDAWVGLHTPNLVANLGKVKERAGGRPVMAVVKADAYGHGIVQVSQALAEAGVDALMVGNTEEAMALRTAEVTVPILNFGAAFGGAAEVLIENDVQQMVDSRDAVSGLVAAAAMQQAEATVHIHIDTGLGRMGVPWQDAGELIEYVGSRSRVRIAGVSTAFTEDPEFDVLQLRRFLEICERAKGAGIDIGRMHAASSAALFGMPGALLDMVRPGIALYGHYPSEESRQRDADVGLAPVLGLRARVVQVKQLQQGDTVGYHRAYVASEPQTIAVLPIGYSDGYPPELAAGGGYTWIRGARCPLVGSINSTHSTVRVPDDLGIQVGELATLIANGGERSPFGAPDEPQNIEQGADPFGGPPMAHMVARWAGISVYELLSRISSKFPRSIEGRRRRF